jgi:hypothetical protein
MTTLREYYYEMGLNDDLIKKLNQELHVSTFTGLTDKVHEKRLDSLNQAKSDIWSHGPHMSSNDISEELKNHHMNMKKWMRTSTPVYELNGYKIGVSRPGKEAATDYNRINHYKHCTCQSCKEGNRVLGVRNPHDMFPYIELNDILMSVKRRPLKNGTVKVTPWTFEHIFSLIENAYTTKQIQLALELMGSIMVRIAFMLDHEMDNNGIIKLNLPKLATKEMRNRLPELGPDDYKVPIEAVIYFLDILGFNEDIKVDVCGYRDLKREFARGIKPQDNGRTNTLLTISHMLAAILHRRPIGEFSYGLHRGLGMNAMSKGQIVPAYPLLSSNIQDILDAKLTDLGWTPLI